LGWGSEGMKIPWVAWDKVCLPIEKDGLGVKDISVFNVDLITKWKWRLGTKNASGWRELIDCRYGDWRDMKTSMLDIKSSNWWKDLGIVCEIQRGPNWLANLWESD